MWQTCLFPLLFVAVGFAHDHGRPVEGYVDLFRGKVTREGKILEASVEPPVELPDEKPNALAVRQLLLAALSAFTFSMLLFHVLTTGCGVGLWEMES